MTKARLETTKPTHWLVSTLGASLSAALGWSLYDAAVLSEAKLGFWEAWTAAAAAGALVACATLVLGLGCAWVWHRSRLGRAIRHGLEQRRNFGAACLLVGTGTLVALSAVTFGSLALMRTFFASEDVWQLGLSGVIPLAALMIWFGARRALVFVHMTLDKKIHRGAHVVPIAGLLSAAMGAGWAFALTELASGVFEQLAMREYAPFLVIAVASTIGGVLSAWRPMRRAAAGLGLLALPLVLAYGMAEPSKQLRLALEYRDTGTGFVFKLVQPHERHTFQAAERNRGKSATCRPEAKPLEPHKIGKAAAEAPNIIWVTVDALRWDHTSLSGYERDTTPRLAAHAEDAAVFERAHTPATSTRQTFQSLFSGVYPSMLTPPPAPKWAMALYPEQHTLPEYLAAAGYRTTALSSESKIFAEENGTFQGFDVVDGSPFEMRVEKGYSAPHVVDRIIEVLEAGEEPQFVWTHIFEPHQPYYGGPDPIDFGSSEVDRYDAAVHFVDGEIGRLLDAIESLPNDKPTYVFLSADHGQAFGEHGNRMHGSTVYQEETHVPLLVWGPNVADARHQTPVSLMDIYPTTFALAGLEVPEAACGENLEPALEALEFDRGPVYFEQVPDRSRANFAVGFINGDHKLVLQPAADAIELFNLASDPAEQRDLARSQHEVLEHHLDALHRYWQERGMSPADYGME